MNVEQAELELIQLAQAGDREAQGRLFQQHARVLLGYLYNKVGSQMVAEDLCQETFLRATRFIQTYNGAASFKNWLFQIAKNLLADHWKAHYKFSTLSFDEFFENTQGTTFEYTEEQQPSPGAEQQLQQILDTLSPEYREILELRFLKGYTLKETAAALNISLANAKVRQFRAITKAQVVAQQYEPK